jgi:hypothetical protein
MPFDAQQNRYLRPRYAPRLIQSRSRAMEERTLEREEANAS